MKVLAALREKIFKKRYDLQYAATFSGTIIIVCTGMHYGWPSPSLPILLDKNSTIPVTDSEGSWIAVMQYVGVPFGCIIGALLVNRIGRKIVTLIASPILFLMWLAVAYSPSALIFMVARFIAGVADGIVHSALPMYIGEISDKNIRGLLGSSIQVSFMFGGLIINIIGLYFNIRTTALIAAIVPVLHFVSFSFAQESPYFYLLKGRSDKATASLKKFTGMENVYTEISELTAVIDQELQSSGSLLDVFKIKANRKPLGIMLLIMLVAQLSGYNAIVFYCYTIFKEASETIDASTATIVYFSVQVVVAAFSCILVDKVGRRPLLITALVGPACALTITGVYFYLKNTNSMDLTSFGWIPLTALFGYTITYSLGLVTIPILMLGEIFPTSVKSYCVCISAIFFSVLLASVSKFFQLVKDEFGMHVPFFVFAACCAIGLVGVIYFVPETKGKSLEQIQIELKGLDCK